MKQLLPLLAIVCLTGCASVPATEITIPKYGTIKSPKQIELKNLSIKTSDGVEVIIGEIRSVNEAAIIGSVGQQNVDLMNATGALVDKIRAASQGGGGLIIP